MKNSSEMLAAIDRRFRPFAAILPAEAPTIAGPLSGVSISVKDILNVAGVPTRWGSLATEGVPPAAADCAAVARLRAAGGAIVAKTTTAEFAHSPLGWSPLTGMTLNPWNERFTCGGSSSGAGVAVATGATEIALATDAGCSTRLPAALSGTFGLKPTLGRIPHDGLPEAFATIVHLGLITATIEMMARALAVVAGEASADPLSIGHPPLGQAPNALEGRRLLVWRRVGNARIDDDAADSLAMAIETFTRLGAMLVEADYPLDNPDACWAPLQQVGWAARFGAAAPADRARLSPTLIAGIEAGTALSGVDLNRALTQRTAFFRGVQAVFAQGFDYILTPCASAGALAADHAVDAPLAIGDVEIGPIRREWIPYLSLFNLTGHPAMTLPCGVDRNGVPMGVQLVTRWNADDALLAAARAFEAACPPPRLSITI